MIKSRMLWFTSVRIRWHISKRHSHSESVSVLAGAWFRFGNGPDRSRSFFGHWWGTLASRAITVNRFDIRFHFSLIRPEIQSTRREGVWRARKVSNYLLLLTTIVFTSESTSFYDSRVKSLKIEVNEYVNFDIVPNRLNSSMVKSNQFAT